MDLSLKHKMFFEVFEAEERKLGGVVFERLHSLITHLINSSHMIIHYEFIQ